MLKFIFVMLIFSSLLFSQTIHKYDNSISHDLSKKENNNVNFELGIRDQISVIFTNLYNYRNGYENYVETILFPINFHITAGLSFLKHFKIDVRIGLHYVYEDFVGIDKGIFINADTFDNLYGALGIDFFNNGGSAHGVTVYSESGGSVTSLCIGLGYHLSKHFDFDLIYYSPTKKVYGYNLVSLENKRYDKINNGVLSLGFQYFFIF